MNRLLCSIIPIIVATGLSFGSYNQVWHTTYEPMRTDYERLSTEDYTSVFFSTFPINNYTEYDFEYYRAIYPIKSAYCIPNINILTNYLSLIRQRGTEINSVYLGVRPDRISADDILTLIEDWRDVSFEIIIAYPSLAYWNSLKPEEYNAQMDSYKDFVVTLMSAGQNDAWMQENFSLYFYADTEWLVANPTNYESNFDVNAGISHSLSLYSDRLHDYYLTADNCEEKLSSFEQLVSESRANAAAGISLYPDLSDWDVVFLGDSLTAYRETSSIPDAFSGLTGAHVYNCAQGGSLATANMPNATFPGIPELVDHFINGNADAFDSESLIYAGIHKYAQNADSQRRQCFVINLGMNDYLCGSPLYADDPYDINTYSGALRTAIETLQKTYPDATIALMSPNVTTNFENGTIAQSEAGGIFADYVDVLESLSREYHIPFYNTYAELEINGYNTQEYLSDGCHPLERTRFLMAQGLAKLFWDVLGEE